MYRVVHFFTVLNCCTGACIMAERMPQILYLFQGYIHLPSHVEKGSHAENVNAIYCYLRVIIELKQTCSLLSIHCNLMFRAM